MIPDRRRINPGEGPTSKQRRVIREYRQTRISTSAAVDPIRTRSGYSFSHDQQASGRHRRWPLCPGRSWCRPRRRRSQARCSAPAGCSRTSRRCLATCRDGRWGRPAAPRRGRISSRRYKAAGLALAVGPVEVWLHRTRRDPAQLGVMLLLNGTRMPAHRDHHHDHLGVPTSRCSTGRMTMRQGPRRCLRWRATSARTERATPRLPALNAEEIGLHGAEGIQTTAGRSAGADSFILQDGHDRARSQQLCWTWPAATRCRFSSRSSSAAKAPVKLVMGHDDPTQKALEQLYVYRYHQRPLPVRRTSWPLLRRRGLRPASQGHRRL